MNLDPNRLVKRLFSMARWKGKPVATSARRKRPTLESLEDRNLMAAMPMGGGQAVEPPAVPAIEAAAHTGDGDVDGRDYVIWRKTLGTGASAAGGVSVDDLAVWQSNYGVGAAAIGGGDLNDWRNNFGSGGSAAPIGGGVDILIANTGGDRVVDLALQCFTSEPSAAPAPLDAKTRLLVGDDQGVFRRSSPSGADARTGTLYVGTDNGVFGTFAANNRGKLIVGVDSVDRSGGNGRDVLLGGAGDDVLVGGQTSHDARSSDRTTVADDVIVDGRIITGENPLSVGKTVRLRFAAVNNAGK
jgi:hypothetical protein